MTDEHLANVLRMLQDSAAAVQVHLGAIIRATLELLATGSEAGGTAEALTTELLGTAIATVSAQEYLETTPLVRAIRRELAGRRTRDARG